MEIAFTRLHLTEHQEEEELPSFVYTEEFISAWYSHWAAVGEKLIWDSWYLKYCNYINPEFDMLGYQQKAYVADSSDEDEDEDRRRNWKTDNEKGSKNSIRTNSTLSENKTIKIPKLTSPTPNENKIITTCKRTSSTSSTPIEHKESNQGQGRKRIIYNEEEEENRSEIDQWSTAWNKHCDEEYNKEYNNFYLAYQPLDVAVTELVGGNAYGKTRPNKRQRLDRNCPAEILENPSLTKEKKTEKVRKRIRVIYSSSEEEETENSSEIAPSDSSSLTDANASHSNEPSTSGAVSQDSDNNEDSQSEEEGTDDTEWNRPAKLTQSMTKKSKNYWLRRYEYFKKYDEGIKLDEESWFSVTPESIASLIASRCKTDGIIIDAFCGCGGNTIKFAKNCFKVIAIDIDPIKIAYARHNATIYGVQDKIEFIEGDYLKLAPYLKGDVVFLSPPWGGINYYKAKVFNIETMIPMNGIKVFELTQNITKDIAYFLPRNIDMNQLVKLAGPGHSIEIQKHVDGARTKVITAYYGDLIQSDNVNESDCVVDVYASDDGSDS